MEFIWDLDDDPEGNVIHIAEHGLSKEDVEHAMTHVMSEQRSRRSGSPLVFGLMRDGREIVVVFEQVDDDSVYPITAYLRGEWEKER